MTSPHPFAGRGSLANRTAAAEYSPATYRRDYTAVTIPGQDGTFDLTDPTDFSFYVRSVFADAGLDGDFAVRVAAGESSLNQNVGPVAEPPGGFSYGPWMLYDGGLLPEFIAWAASVGENPDPFDPVSTTKYVAQKVAADPTAWNNWSVAKNLLDQGVQPGDAGPRGQQDTPLDWANFGQNERVLEERTLQDMISQQLTSSGQGQDVARGILSALLQASPLMAPPGMNYIPGLEPFGAGQALGQRAGVNVPPAPINRMTLPISMLSGASPLSQGAIAQQYGGLR